MISVNTFNSIVTNLYKLNSKIINKILYIAFDGNGLKYYHDL